MKTAFFIPGSPAAQGRPRTRVIRMGRRSVAQIYNPHNADEWKARVSIIARSSMVGPAPALLKLPPLLGAVRLSTTFLIERPRNHYRITKRFGTMLRADAPMWHIVKPDGDNFAKALMDAITGIIWRDDSQVCDQRIQKLYINDDKPGCLVTIETIDPIEPEPSNN